ncbi:hypothetical protein AAG570_004068 [Ranatra chinensis]|uniref:Superkiller viralicidic activity 2-like 2 n=1 Tax=Ranatra chinensis TaxID=642074 RepID=A0ABD0YFA8_9HEMI
MEYKTIKKPTTAPAKEYKFILDPFQKEAIMCIENDESVLVSAHTSAGKTVVAEYSIAMSMKRKQRVIYTTPIKALSNQKYREFYEEFKDVGLITGDVTINSTAGCLIMTTEILRNMLYHGSEIMKEVSWVIFDEIHYMRDKERGVVWEESLILLPNNVHYVFLSATIPNARQFAEWVAYVHDQPCHVVYTDYRPTPLQHYIFPVGSDGIHLVVNEEGTFLEQNFENAMSKFENSKGGGPKAGPTVDCFKVVKMILERNLAPAIVFAFSKKECEQHALSIAQLDFNTREQKILVDEVFENAMGVLKDEDKNLPQVQNVLPLLRRGIGIHHGGLLPILKETIEIMFSEGLIKALFATETFAMGLNMPARTVIFTGVRKFDGRNHRHITSGEFIQMSGRAGRRGLDDKGIVIVMLDEKVTPEVGRELLQGSADPLNSAFHLTYNMILNLLRVDEINPEYLIERSFSQFQNCSKIPQLESQIKKLQVDYDRILVENEASYKVFYDLKQQQKELETRYYSSILKPEHLIPYLQPGRLVKVTGAAGEEYDWGIVVNFKKVDDQGRDNVIIFVLVPMIKTEDKSKCMEIVSLPFSNIVSLSSLRIHHPDNLRSSDNRQKVLKVLNTIGVRFKSEIPKLDPVRDLGMKDDGISNLLADINKIKTRLNKLGLERTSDFTETFEKFSRKMDIKHQMDAVESEINEAMSLLQLKELKCRKRVLRRLGFCTSSDIIELKGRVACEVTSAEEIVITEMLFSGIFGELTTEQTVSLLSCFVCEERSSENYKVREELTSALRKLKDIAKRVVRVCAESKLQVDEDEYVGRFKANLMDVVYAWCKGATFSEICTMTDMFEGSIIRCFKQLEEFLRQLVQAARTIGNVELETKFSHGITLIKRDIIFAASLYL